MKPNLARNLLLLFVSPWSSVHGKDAQIIATRTMINANTTENSMTSNPGTRTNTNSITAVIPSFRMPIDRTRDDFNLPLVIGCVAAAVVVLSVVLLSVFITYNKRRREPKDKSSDPVEYSPVPVKIVDRSWHDAESNDEYEEVEHKYQGITSTKEKSHTKNTSMRPGLSEKIITTYGGVIQIDDITLRIDAGCLAKDTKITLRKDDQNILFKSLLDLGLVDAAPRVVEFSPDGLKFIKPADLTFRFEKTDSASELFILYGCYSQDSQRIVWEPVTYDINENSRECFVNVKINSFSLYSYILSSHGRIARLLSHLHNSFVCRAYALYRRLPSMPTIDIAAIFVSKFVEQQGEVKELKVLYDEGYIKGEKGSEKCVNTESFLEMSLKFSGVENSSFKFKIDVPLLDTDGFVVDHFKAIAKESPVSGIVDINELNGSDKNELLWSLTVCEIKPEIKKEEVQVLSASQDDPKDLQPKVVYRTTKLTNREISRLSLEIGVDWDSLAGLMDIPYRDREEIRSNFEKFPDSSSKAQKIFAFFNDREDFDRHNLDIFFEELGRDDVKNKMLPVEEQTEELERPETPLPNGEVDKNENDYTVHNSTRLSSREMSRLSRRFVKWESLAGLMDIARETTDKIQINNMYKDANSKAEKILWIFNCRNDFSRNKLAESLREIGHLDLIEPITTGQWRDFKMPKQTHLRT